MYKNLQGVSVVAIVTFCRDGYSIDKPAESRVPASREFD